MGSMNVRRNTWLKAERSTVFPEIAEAASHKHCQQQAELSSLLT